MAPLISIPATLASLVVVAVEVQAHGAATALVRFPGVSTSGTFYRGYNPSYQYMRPPPDVVGWSTPDDLQNTFVSPKDYATGDFVCHVNAKNAPLEMPVSGGDVVEVQWNEWPASHMGPILDYLAPCQGLCQTVDKLKLNFFKIAEAGIMDKAQDLWAGNYIVKNNMSWLIRIPNDIAPGNYVLRHEIIALHASGTLNGAQHYPFCFNLAISTNGTLKPDGIPASKLYKNTDPGILYDLFKNPRDPYTIPGPKLYPGAVPFTQTKPGKIVATEVPPAVSTLDMATAPKPATPTTTAAPKPSTITTVTKSSTLAGSASKKYVTTVVVHTKVVVTTHTAVTITTTMYA